jgi:excisionase family DNA binding protein
MAGNGTNGASALVRTAWVATRLGMHRHTVLKLVREGKIPAPVVESATSRLWRRRDIEEFIGEEANGVSAGSGRGEEPQPA